MTITEAMMDANEERLRRDYPDTEISVEQSKMVEWRSKLEIISDILRCKEKNGDQSRLTEEQQNTLGLFIKDITDQMNKVIGDESD